MVLVSGQPHHAATTADRISARAGRKEPSAPIELSSARPRRRCEAASLACRLRGSAGWELCYLEIKNPERIAVHFDEFDHVFIDAI